MPVIPKIINGRLDMDSSPHLVDKADFIDALNITREQGSGGSFNDDAVRANIKGNRFIPYNLPGGTSKVIGNKPDPLRNCVYYMLYNSAGFHTIARYNNSTRTISTVFQSKTDSANIDILQWNVNYKINHIDIVHRDEGDLLYWTDPLTRKINVTRALNGDYAPAVAIDLDAAKAPPLFPPLAEYISDSNIVVNNVNKNLFEFAYRYIYDDFEKSTFSPLSISPLRQYDYLTSFNPLANNAIQVTVDTGGRHVTKIEIAVRLNLGNLYSDYYSVNTIDKSALGLSDDTAYSFNFANDAAYTVIDVNESIQLFDYVPRRANAQCLVNGNYLVYGGILEGYLNLARNEMDVTTVVTYEEIPLPGGLIVIGDPTFDYTPVTAPGGSVVQLNLQVGATVTPGDIYGLSFTIQLIPFSGCSPSGTGTFSFSYTAILGDDNDDVASYFTAQIDALTRVAASNLGGGSFHINTVPSTCYRFVDINISATAATTSATGDFFDRIYKFNSKFRFGMLYFDEQGRTPGVQTYITQPGNTNDFEVDIENFNARTGGYMRPVINLTVQHLPPSWAKSFSFVRTKNLVTTSYFMWKCDDVQDDGSFFYIGIDNLETFTAANPNFTSAWTFATGDRIRVSYQFNNANPTGWGAVYSPVLDQEIIGVVEFGTPAKTYIKIRKYSGTIAPDPYDDRSVFEVYRPALKTTASNLLYYEFGETYECQIIDGINYHQGQNASTNPTFEFRDGDAYIRIRPGTGDQYLVLDPNFSDYTVSAVASDGRSFIVDENAGETYNPTLVRFSQAYQFGTNINGLNRFYFENFDEYARAYGDIWKLDYYASYMKVGQVLRIGNVPVLLQIVNTADGTGSLTSSDQLLNTIVYYQGDFGIGTAPESWARNNFVVYGCDNIRGVVWRLSQDGITVISILYKVNSWATTQLPLRTGNSKIYGVYNADVNRYEIALEEAPDLDVLSVNVSEKFAFSGNFRLAVNLEDVCTNPLQVLYMGEAFGVGTIMYTTNTFVFNVTEANYIADEDGNIYNIDPGTGEVGSLTGGVCGTGTGASYRLDDSVLDICSSPVVTLYTNGAFAVGKILYYDSALSVPVTGFDYVFNVSNDTIYNLDNVTGEIGLSTGLNCSALATLFISNNLPDGVIDQVTLGAVIFSGPINFGGSADGTHIAFTGVISVQVSGTATPPAKVQLSRNSIPIDCVAVSGAGTYPFASFTYAETDIIDIILDTGTC